MVRSKNMGAWVALLLLVPFAGPSVQALNVLIADDYFDGDLDFLVSALVGHNVTHLDNTDTSNDPIYTEDLAFLSDFDVVIFSGSGDGSGRTITAAEQTALKAYIQSGGNLIATGYDTLGSPDDPRLADVVRSSTYGDETGISSWTAANLDHFILNGRFGDYRGDSINLIETDHDQLTADAARGAVSLGFLDSSSFDKIIFTDLPAPGGSVGMWNGNQYGADWDPAQPAGNVGLRILRNWLAGVADADRDGVFDSDDNCPNRTNSDQADGDGVGDVCDQPACCGATGPVAPLGLVIGMLLLSRSRGYRSTGRSK